MEKRPLTKKLVESLPLPKDKASVAYYDGGDSKGKVKPAHGFGVMIFNNGRRAFFILYGPPHKRRRMYLGQLGDLTVEEAREKARKLLAAYRTDGKDPLDEKKARRERERIEDGKRRKFKVWAEERIEWAKENRKSHKDIKCLLNKAVDRFGNKYLADITTDMLKKEFDRISKDSPIVANRWIEALRAGFYAAVEDGLIEKNPLAKFKKNAEHEGRARALSDAEFAALLKAIDEHPNIYERAAFLMLVKTGARLGEVLHAKWEDFDFDSLLWTMPETKAGRKQTIPIHESLVAELQALPQDGPYVVRGLSPFKPRADLKKGWAKLLKASGIKKHTTLHDLRRTFCVRIARTAGLQIASKLLRHSNIKVTEKHYLPVEAEQMREALERNEAAVIKFKKKSA